MDDVTGIGDEKVLRQYNQWREVCMLVGAAYRPGDPAPEGYLAWHEWAGVQYKAGLRQTRCPRCDRWCFPQELSDIVDELPCFRFSREKGGREDLTLKERVCLKCAKEAPCK